MTSLGAGPGGERRAWLLVALTTALIYGTIPLARWLQRLVTDHADRRIFAWVVLALVGVALIALLAHLWRTRATGLPRRSAWLLTIAVAYGWFALHLRSAPEEAVHLIEYALLSVVALRALAFRIHDRWAHVAAALVAILAGTGDECLQWLIPGRYFDFRDIAINAMGGSLIQVAIAFGLAPRARAAPPTARSLVTVLRLLALEFLILVLLVANSPARVEWYARRVPGLDFLRSSPDIMCEFGYRFETDDLAVYSRLDRERLRREDQRRAAEAASVVDDYLDDRCYGEFLERFPPGIDPFLHELKVHLFRRDRYLMVGRALGESDPAARDNHLLIALGETRILAEYFPASLALSRYILAADDEALLAQAPGDEPYESEVSRGLITRVREPTLLGALALAAALALVAAERLKRRA